MFFLGRTGSIDHNQNRYISKQQKGSKYEFSQKVNPNTKAVTTFKHTLHSLLPEFFKVCHTNLDEENVL